MSEKVEGKGIPSLRSELYKAIAPYSSSDRRKAIQQVFLPYALLWGLMIFLMARGTSYWLILGLILIAAGFQVRIFILFHDAGHGSFFKITTCKPDPGLYLWHFDVHTL